MLEELIRRQIIKVFTNDKGLNENMKLLENIHFEFNNTVGPKSISKQELIKEFNKYI